MPFSEQIQKKDVLSLNFFTFCNYIEAAGKHDGLPLASFTLSFQGSFINQYLKYLN